MTVLQSLVNVLDKSIYSSLLVADPCFVQVRNDYTEILEFLADTKEISIEVSTGEEREYLILLAKKEIFMRLAVSVSPEFNIEAEFTKLLKSDRFTHYMALVRQMTDDIDRASENASVEVGQFIIEGRNGTLRNYNLSSDQLISPVFVLAADHVDISWNKFNMQECGDFSRYEIFYGIESFYDEYEEAPIDQSKVNSYVMITDFHKPLYRVKNLASLTPYYFLIVFAGKDGRKSYNYSTQTTL